jgi:hypothetical protein
MRLAALLASLVAVAAAAPPAVAATGSFEVPRLPGSTLPDETIPKIVGPRPAGDLVAFAIGDAAGGWSVGLGAPGVVVRRLAAYPPKKNASLELEASPSRIAVVRHAWDCSLCRYMDYFATLDAVIAGPVAGPLTPLASCERGRQPCSGAGFLWTAERPQFSAALGDDVLAVVDGCARTARVVDLATGGGGVLGPAAAVAAGGRFVATTEGRPGTLAATVVVRDGVSRTELYRAGVPAADTVPAAQMAVLPDGGVVYTAPGQQGQLALVFATPQAPAGRVLRLVPFDTAIGGAGSGVVLLTSGSAAPRLVSLASGGEQEIPLPDVIAGPFLDGRTIAWAQRGCVTTVITSWRLGDPRPAVPDLRCPTPRPSRAALTLPRNRRLSVELACPATARGGCLADLRLTAITRRRARRGANAAERLYRLGRTAVALDPGTRGRSEVIVASGAARWVRRHAPMRLKIEAVSQREELLLAGDRGHVVRSVTLRAAR